MSRCDSCDPSYGCFDGSAPCSKVAPQVRLVTRRVPKIDPETGTHMLDEFGELIETEEIDMMATLMANPEPLMKLARGARDILDRLTIRAAMQPPINRALIGTAALPDRVGRHPQDSAAANHK